VDEIYMAATQLITRSARWPNSVFLTPDLEPFFAGTYFPPTDGRGRPGFRGSCRACARRGSSAVPSCSKQAQMVAQAMRQHLGSTGRVGVSFPARDRGRRPGGARRPVRPRVGRLRPGAEVPLAREPLLPSRALGRRRGAADAGHDARPDGARRPDGPAGRRLPPVLDGRGRGWCRTSRRCSTTTRRSPGSTPRPRRSRRGRLRPGGALDARFRAARDDGPRGRLPLGDRRGDGRSRGRLLHLDGRRAGRALPGDEGASSARCTASRGRRLSRASATCSSCTPLAAAGAHRRALGGRPAATARAGPPLAPRGPLTRERPLTDDKVLADWNGLMIGAMARGGARLAEPRYIAAAERAAGFVLSRMADGAACNTLSRGPRPRGRIPRRLRVPRGGAPPAARATGTRGGSARRSGSPGSRRAASATPRAAAASRPPRPEAPLPPRSPPSTAPWRPGTASRR